jgi:DedD protein
VREGLKQRLVGAFVLVALAVIFLPGVFREQQSHQVSTHSLIPPQPQVDVIEFNTPEPSFDVESAPDPETMFIPSEAPDPMPSPVTSAPAGELSPVPEIPLNEKGVPEAWVVQVVSLSNKAAAVALRDELQRDGHKAYLREVTTDSGTFSRVYIGPKLDRAEALAIKKELDQRLKVNSQVRRFEP